MQIKSNALHGGNHKTYAWDDFYKETEPSERNAILQACKGDLPPEEAEQIETVFALRYSQNRRGEYADRFMGTFMELIFLARSAGDAAAKNRTAVRASKKKQEKELAAYRRAFGFDRTDLPRELLLKEMVHLCASYAVLNADDKAYSRMLFGIGRLKDEKISRKLTKDFREVQEYLSAAGRTEQFALLDEAIEQTIEEYL